MAIGFFPLLFALYQIALLIATRLYQVVLIPLDIAYVIYRVLLTRRKRKDSGKKHVVVVGGGFAGSTVARLLEYDYEVTLVDSKKYFEFTPSVLRALVEPEHSKVIQKPHLHYLQHASVLHDVASSISSTAVSTTHEQLSYDYLVLCTGAAYSSIPGDHKNESLVVSSRVNPLTSMHPALTRAQSVLIIGAGTVGVELAAEIRERFPSMKVILAGPLLARSPPRAIRYAEKWLRSHDVELLPTEKVLNYDGSSFFASSGRVLQADCAFVCTGNMPNTQYLKSSKDFSTAVNERGFVRVNEFLQMEGTSNVFAAGDITYIIGEDEKLCQDALVQGKIIADNIRRLDSRRPRLRKYEACKRPMLISLGKFDGMLVYRGWTLCGFICALMKEFVEWKEMLPFHDSLLSLTARMRYSKNQHVV
jgi:NADH dehydrogenase FAD-containing subunit